jgi:phosphoenolpyruvate phosphomutase
MLTKNKDKLSLRQSLHAGNKLRFMEAHNGLSALVAGSARDNITDAEFDGVWVSSLTCTAAAGLPDLEMSIIDNRVAAIREIAQISVKPVLVDGDTGGDTSALRYFCRALERIGVGGVIVEEKALPKRNSLDDGPQSLAKPHEFAAKLMAAKEVLEGPDFMVLARLESLISGRGMPDALRRADTYVRAGVDGILIHSKSRSDREVIEFARTFRSAHPSAPLFCVPTTYHTATASSLFEAGIQGVIYANHQLRAAHAAMRATCLSILKHDRSSEVEAEITPAKQILDEVGYTAEVTRIAAIERSLRPIGVPRAISGVARASAVR